jgi:hypothetical protein
MRNPSHGKVRRWYRCKKGIWQNTAALSCGVAFVGLLLVGVGAANDYAVLLVGGLLTVAGLLMLTVSLRAGIGIADEGVLVRSTLGWRRWASWSEIEHFEIVRPWFWRGNGRGIAVMLINRRPLVADGCCYQPWNNWTESNWKILQDMLNALEDERAAAQRPLNSATDGNL